MNPMELTQGHLTEWVQTAIKAEREAAGLDASNGKPEMKQGELNFISDFQGLKKKDERKMKKAELRG